MAGIGEWVALLAVFGAVVILAFVLITRVARAIVGPRRRLERDLGVEVLDARLARGEIARDEYEQAKRAGIRVGPAGSALSAATVMPWISMALADAERAPFDAGGPGRRPGRAGPEPI